MTFVPRLAVAAITVASVAACGGQRTSKVEVGEAQKPVATPPAPAPTEPAPTEPATPAEPQVAVAPPAPPAPVGFPADCSVTPPSQAHHDILWGTGTDRAPEILDGVRPEKFGQHYYVSDEGHADRMREFIADGGGGYVGIGSDQAYLYIGWARPQFAWTVDYDPEIVRMHQIQQAFFVAAATPDEYRALWQRDHDKQAKAIVEGMSADKKVRRQLLSVLGQGQPRMRRRMARLERNLKDSPSYLTDQPTYDFVRNLIRNGCVRPLLVDLLAKDGLKGIAAAATEVGIPIRTLYLSNAEEYWTYTDQFRANIRALPRDARSMVIHTQSSNANEDYRYTAQPIDNFVAWLDDGWAKNANMMLGRAVVNGPTHFPGVRFEGDPAAARAARTKKPRK